MARSSVGLGIDDDNSDNNARGSTSPATSFSSDKENRLAFRAQQKKRSSPMVSARDGSASKKQKTVSASQAAYKDTQARITDKNVYDPEQNPEERRRVRRGIRELQKTFIDSRPEYMAAESKGIYETVIQLDTLFGDIKQTGDAALDSNLLVNVGEAAAKRAVQTKLGSASRGIDLDEFVSKCAAFMRRGPSEREIRAIGLTQSARRRRANDDDSEDETEHMNWEWLGRKGCLPFNLRPGTPNFLLGPLSTQKKVRKVTQRTQRQARHNPKDAIRPDEVKITEMEKAENSNLILLCSMIRTLISEHIAQQQTKVEAAITKAGGIEVLTEEEYERLYDDYGIHPEGGGVDYCKFAFNPKSFGQTVENIFYISFLLRDGQVGLTNDERGIMYIGPMAPSTPEELKANPMEKQQTVLHIDFDLWQSIVESAGITKSVIPHRVSEHDREVAVSGWYA